jgi:hypothetical protein
MEQAIKRLRAIPVAQQDEVARFVIAELEEDVRWSQSTAKHQDKLRGLMDEVLKDDA